MSEKPLSGRVHQQPLSRAYVCAGAIISRRRLVWVQMLLALPIFEACTSYAMLCFPCVCNARTRCSLLTAVIHSLIANSNKFISSKASLPVTRRPVSQTSTPPSKNSAPVHWEQSPFKASATYLYIECLKPTSCCRRTTLNTLPMRTRMQVQKHTLYVPEHTQYSYKNHTDIPTLSGTY